jgi:hypothetical protein
MAPDIAPAARFADCVSGALDRCRTALSDLQQPQSWVKRNVFGHDEPVSEADLEVERILIGALRALDPGLPVVAEEQHPELADHLPGRCAVIDPIDGTVPFLQGMPFYGITGKGGPPAPSWTFPRSGSGSRPPRDSGCTWRETSPGSRISAPGPSW